MKKTPDQLKAEFEKLIFTHGVLEKNTVINWNSEDRFKVKIYAKMFYQVDIEEIKNFCDKNGLHFYCSTEQIAAGFYTCFFINSKN